MTRKLIIDDKLVRHVQSLNSVDITFIPNCKLLEGLLLLRPDDFTLADRKLLIFVHGNAPSHAGRPTIAFLKT